MVNKIDRQILELKNDSETMYLNFIRVVDMANVIIQNYESPDMGDLLIYPEKGNASFGSGKECWAFTIRTFGKIYAKKFNQDVTKMMQKLWGDNYYDAAAKKWKNVAEDENGQLLKRSFCTFIMEPIMRLARSCMDGNVELMTKMLTQLEIPLKQEEKTL